MSTPCPAPRSTSRSSTQTHQRLRQPQNHHHRRPQVRGRMLRALEAETAILQSSLSSWLFYLWCHEIHLVYWLFSRFTISKPRAKMHHPDISIFWWNRLRLCAQTVCASNCHVVEYTRMKTTSSVICHIHLRNSNEWQDSKGTQYCHFDHVEIKRVCLKIYNR